MKRLIISGAAGRMGKAVAALSREYGFETVAGIDVKAEAQCGFPLCSSYALCRENADMMIDFSRASHLMQTLDFAKAHRLPAVIGTTGLEAAHEEMLASAAESIPILQSANFSLGIQTLKKLCLQAKACLPDFDIEIVERHHAQKTDAPGGTALMLLQAVSDPEACPVYGRYAALQKREKQEIGIHSLRGGTLCGSHETGFYGQGEHLLITHVAEDRSIFARGALMCARWLLDQPPGRYGAGDVLQ